ncbi:hypothetical protein [Gloeocapsopsis dulcis]|uniref:hypothetical protein n=1 Tax=Gloeocapsopsis dulcis TaxID=2859516 RepID=UPI0012DAB19B|nr:hypothetical protein [Gloeocapsopsis dulcis]WNN92094.1 hypothetical protein P0S91_25455 [Gloeocapsopsis dulcis]
MNEPQHELERQRLLAECHGLIALIGRKHYSLKLLKVAKSALQTVAAYKQNRAH